MFASASRIVAGVACGGSLAAWPVGSGFGESGGMRGAVMNMVYGTLRRYGRGDALIGMLAHRGTPDTEIRALLLCALNAIETGDYAEHVAVDQAVQACGALNRPAARRFVNALLRSFLRQRDSLTGRVSLDPVAKAMHPAWWIDVLRDAYPHDWESVLDAGNRHPPMGLRVNRRRTTVEAYAARLEENGMPARRVGDSALLLGRPVPVSRLPGFADGDVSVQDAGAQRAAEYLDLRDGQNVLDACAAPGGKTGHMLETASIDLLALDSDPERCERVRQNLSRLGLCARILAADCTCPDEWWDGRLFDRVLADVPCTASGIVRRNPDIKWLRRPGDSARFALEQARILAALWRVVKPGGKLLYATCSVFPQENAAVVEALCVLDPAARRLALAGNAPAQMLPNAEHDGFFFALIQKET